MTAIRTEARRGLLLSWLGRCTAGGEVVKAIRSCLREWIEARVGNTFYTTRLLTGYGCFGQYLKRIGKEVSERCWQCRVMADIAGHTLRYCTEFTDQREMLSSVIGRNLSMPAIMRAMMRRETRDAVVKFCESVIRRKE
ncbi:PREDICTED: uncharacterized protein LOC108761075 [Trachymyrmex cornetzi]|uniref:uncharacterized protein LOC108761075 n=1 Tax=Trachymyrmex cornetzi TaxID=471704 RepID=UPI00084F12AB|nr:PREDICTED: uncharacterized protein LOC108761075 [Trachymyrmex cornetzi]